MNEVDQIEKRVHHILMTDEEVASIIECLVKGQTDSLNATFDIIKRVTYVYNFTPILNTESEHLIGKLVRYFVMGSQETIIESMNKKLYVLKHISLTLACLLLVLFLILVLGVELW